MKNPDSIKALQLKIKNLEKENLLLKKKLNAKASTKNTVKTPKELKPIFSKAEKIVGEYFNKINLNPKKGVITINNERYVLVRASALSHEFFQCMMDLYKDRGKTESQNIGKNILFDIGHVIGMEDAKLIHKKMRLKNPIEKLSAGPVHFAYSGWASVEILPESNPSPDENFFLKYNHPYSFEADAWIKSGIKSKQPVCTMNAAYSSGWCQESYGIPLTAVEITCRAKGDKHCTFIMAHPSKIESYLNKEVAVKKLKQKPQIPLFFERKAVEEKLHKNEKLLNTAQKISKLGSWEFDLLTHDLTWSDELYNIFDIKADKVDKSNLYNEYLSRIHKDDLSELTKSIENSILTGAQYTVKHRIVLPNGKIKWVVGAGVPLLDNKQKVVKLTGYAQDITEKVETEIELNQFFKLSLDMLCLANNNGYFLKVSKGWEKTLGYSLQELTSKPFMSFIHPDDINITKKELSKLINGQHVYEFENRYKHKTGSYKVLNWNCSPDKATGLIYCIVRDVTKEREAERKLKTTLNERETLLKEIHHRVKNNLQIISSLLKLHSEKNNNNDFSDLVTESQNRIVSMALIHEMLYAKSDLNNINLKQYIHYIFDKLQSSYNKKEIILKEDIPSNLVVEIDRMIPIGLILNEAISNSFKYAFAKDKGNVSIEVTGNKLLICDDGKGFPENFDFKSTTGFGTQLMMLLSEQLDAKIHFKSNNGSCIELTFKQSIDASVKS